METLPTPLLDGLLDALGVDRRAAPGLGRLRALTRAWSLGVPYDSTTKVAQLASGSATELVGLEPAELVGRFLDTGAGATCFDAAGAFAALVRGCGFAVVVRRAWSLRVLRDAASGWGPAHHAVCEVALYGQRYVFDPAFVHHDPVPLAPTWRAGGPPFSPLWTTTVDGTEAIVVARSRQAENSSYVLGGPLDAAGMRAAYEVAGRHPLSWEPFLRRSFPDRQLTWTPTAS